MKSWKMACAVLALAACASEVARQPTRFVPIADAPKTITVAYDVVAPLAAGFRARVPGASRWRLVGNVPQGEVYRPADGGVFSISGRNYHEAYLVVDSGYLAGFYLPGEGAFASLKSGKQKLDVKTE